MRRTRRSWWETVWQHPYGTVGTFIFLFYCSLSQPTEIWLPIGLAGTTAVVIAFFMVNRLPYRVRGQLLLLGPGEQPAIWLPGVRLALAYLWPNSNSVPRLVLQLDSCQIFVGDLQTGRYFGPAGLVALAAGLAQSPDPSVGAVAELVWRLAEQPDVRWWPAHPDAPYPLRPAG